MRTILIQVPVSAPEHARAFLAAKEAYERAAVPILKDDRYSDEEGAAFDAAHKDMYGAAYAFALSCAAEIGAVAEARTT